MSLKKSPALSLYSMFSDSRGYYLYALLFGAVCNLLILSSPLFTLQVYDRVLTSQSLPTLMTLAGITVAALLTFMLVDVARSMMLSRAAIRLDHQLSEVLVSSSVRARPGSQSHGSVKLLQDLDQLRGFISGPGVAALTDLPWIPFFLLVIALIHPQLGMLACIASALLILLAVISERMTSGWTQRARQGNC